MFSSNVFVGVAVVVSDDATSLPVSAVSTSQLSLSFSLLCQFPQFATILCRICVVDTQKGKLIKLH